MTPIERCARALAALDTGDDWHLYEQEARAVLQALREPSEGMIEAGIASVEVCTDDWTASAACAAGHAWQVMIDKALEEQEGIAAAPDGSC